MRRVLSLWQIDPPLRMDSPLSYHVGLAWTDGGGWSCFCAWLVKVGVWLGLKENRGRGGPPRPRHWELNPDSDPGNRPFYEMGLFLGCGFLAPGESFLNPG
jgi:hypothetical protein